MAEDDRQAAQILRGLKKRVDRLEQEKRGGDVSNIVRPLTNEDTGIGDKASIYIVNLATATQYDQEDYDDTLVYL